MTQQELLQRLSSGRDPWQILQLDPTPDERAIKRAYAKCLKLIRPDEFPEEFQRLRYFYEWALSIAQNWEQYDDRNESEVEEPSDEHPLLPVSTSEVDEQSQSVSAGFRVEAQIPERFDLSPIPALPETAFPVAPVVFSLGPYPAETTVLDDAPSAPASERFSLPPSASQTAAPQIDVDPDGLAALLADEDRARGQSSLVDVFQELAQRAESGQSAEALQSWLGSHPRLLALADRQNFESMALQHLYEAEETPGALGVPSAAVIALARSFQWHELGATPFAYRQFERAQLLAKLEHVGKPFWFGAHDEDSLAYWLRRNRDQPESQFASMRRYWQGLVPNFGAAMEKFLSGYLAQGLPLELAFAPKAVFFERKLLETGFNRVRVSLTLWRCVFWASLVALVLSQVPQDSSKIFVFFSLVLSMVLGGMSGWALFTAKGLVRERIRRETWLDESSDDNELEKGWSKTLTVATSSVFAISLVGAFWPQALPVSYLLSVFLLWSLGHFGHVLLGGGIASLMMIFLAALSPMEAPMRFWPACATFVAMVLYAFIRSRNHRKPALNWRTPSQESGYNMGNGFIALVFVFALLRGCGEMMR